MVDRVSRRAAEGRNACFFDLLFQLVDGLDSTRQVRDPSTHRVESEQLAIGKPYTRNVRRERDEETIAISEKVLGLSESHLERLVVDTDVVEVWLCTR